MVATWVVVATPAVGGILGLITAAITAGLAMLVMVAAATLAAEMAAAAVMGDIKMKPRITILMVTSIDGRLHPSRSIATAWQGS